MRNQIKEHGKYIEITGFRNVKINDAEAWIKTAQTNKHQGAAVQFFDADLVATWEHLYFAVVNALTAFATHRNISRNLAMEMMLYASAQRQIRKAIGFIGVKRGAANVAVVIIGDDIAQVQAALSAVQKLFGKEPDESILELSGGKIELVRGAFGISDEEVKAVIEKNELEKALVNLVIERMALLPTQL
jgi:tRNA threonylcarbamoyladenosine modification (KEOPS) complex Cgi121 subunit